MGEIDDTLAGWKPGDPIGYVRQEIPQFNVPAYTGERYTAQVPDTLDLQDRTALAVNVLTSATDPLADYEIYFWGRIKSNPPVMRHDYSDLCGMKFMEALPLMRIASGSDLNPQVERRWMEVALKQIDQDGLAYWPTKGRPWALDGAGGFVRMGAGAQAGQLLFPIYCGRLLSAMTLYFQRDGGTLWKDTAERMVDGLIDLAVDRGSYAYFSPQPSYAEKGSTSDPGSDNGIGAQVNIVALGLTHLYRKTGYEPARQLAEKLIRYTFDVVHYFDQDAHFNPDDKSSGNPRGHFHEHTRDLQSFLEYGLLTNNTALQEFACKGFEYARTQGNVLLGYFPEFVNSPEEEFSELCEVADMVALALKLSEAGIGDYWDDADRWGRNMLVEGQLTRGDWIDRMHRPWNLEKWDDCDFPRSSVAYNETAERVSERLVGCFTGYARPNDWWPGITMGTMHCCTGNATRALYYLWDSILRYDHGKLRVNLLLNRASPWADVDSHIPYVGQVDVKVKQPLDLSLRIPEWVKPSEARVQVNGQDRTVSWAGRYAQVGAVKPGDVATMRFPIAERTDNIFVEKKRYWLVRRGNDVVKIEPPGVNCPLYQREHYRTNATRWRPVERFVSQELIHW